MRFGAMIAAALVASVAVPAGAATIVQTDSDLFGQGFVGFDSRLGTLNSVTLDVNLAKYRDWQVRRPAGLGPTIDVAWSVSSNYTIDNVPGLSSSLEVPIGGSGTVNVFLTEFDGVAYGYFSLPITGAATFALNASAFIDAGFFGLSGTDRGRFIDLGDTTLSALGADRFLRSGGSCDGLPLGDDTCGTAAYRLTYDYSEVTAAVPEPATWSMMLLGFGGIGYGMRRRTAKVALA